MWYIIFLMTSMEPPRPSLRTHWGSMEPRLWTLFPKLFFLWCYPTLVFFNSVLHNFSNSNFIQFIMITSTQHFHQYVCQEIKYERAQGLNLLLFLVFATNWCKAKVPALHIIILSSGKNLRSISHLFFWEIEKNVVKGSQ